jgi:hypothetical protein
VAKYDIKTLMLLLVAVFYFLTPPLTTWLKQYQLIMISSLG